MFVGKIHWYKYLSSEFIFKRYKKDTRYKSRFKIYKRKYYNKSCNKISHIFYSTYPISIYKMLESDFISNFKLKLINKNGKLLKSEFRKYRL